MICTLRVIGMNPDPSNSLDVPTAKRIMCSIMYILTIHLLNVCSYSERISFLLPNYMYLMSILGSQLNDGDHCFQRQRFLARFLAAKLAGYQNELNKILKSLTVSFLKI